MRMLQRGSPSVTEDQTRETRQLPKLELMEGFFMLVDLMKS